MNFFKQLPQVACFTKISIKQDKYPLFNASNVTDQIGIACIHKAILNLGEVKNSYTPPAINVHQGWLPDKKLKQSFSPVFMRKTFCFSFNKYHQNTVSANVYGVIWHILPEK